MADSGADRLLTRMGGSVILVLGSSWTLGREFGQTAVEEGPGYEIFGEEELVRVRKFISFLFLGAFVGFLLLACGTEPVTMAEVAVYPEAEPMTVGQSQMADELARIIRNSAGGEGVDVEINLYSLSADVSWDDIKSYYSRELAETDWTAEDELTTESEVISTIGWGRGRGASQQALIVGHVVDVVGDGAFMIVGLFSE
jgi:hypothetical protein